MAARLGRCRIGMEPAGKNWTDFVRRTEAHFRRADQAEVNYSTSVYDPIVEVKKLTDTSIQVTLSTEIPGLEIHYSFDEFYPDAYYPVYSGPLVFPAGATSLKLVTYRNRQKIGKSINLPLDELKKRVKMN
ncbi:MAG: FN3 associated domain-containing protein [Flavihumibacter sp.]